MSLNLSGLIIQGRTSITNPVVITNWSGLFSTSTGRRVSTPVSPIFAFGAGNYTAECWVYTSTTMTTAGLISLRNNFSANYNNVLGVISGRLAFSNGASWNQGSTTLPLNQWVHVALVRNSGIVKIYQNGTSILSTSYAASITGNRQCVIGNLDTADYPFTGSISNVRVTNTAVYTSDFTSPVEPLTVISGTQLLTLQDSTIIDNSSNEFSLTVTSVTMQNIGPF